LATDHQHQKPTDLFSPPMPEGSNPTLTLAQQLGQVTTTA